MRQYDASFELVLDRDMVLTYQGSNTVSTDALTEQEIEDENKDPSDYHTDGSVAGSERILQKS